jgi:hypothetical protein
VPTIEHAPPYRGHRHGDGQRGGPQRVVQQQRVAAQLEFEAKFEIGSSHFSFKR